MTGMSPHMGVRQGTAGFTRGAPSQEYFRFVPREEVVYLFSVGGNAEDVVGIEYLFERGKVAPEESSKFCIMRKERKNE